MPMADDLAKRYDSDYQDYEIENAEKYLELMLLGLHDLGFSTWEKNFSRDRTFLDIGCATGTLVEYMKKRAWNSFGLEICKESAEYGRLHRGVEIFNCTLDEVPLPRTGIDFIHSSHVIEHVPDPLHYVESIYQLLKPEGYCVTITPNITSLQATLFGKEWRSAIADHVNLFSIDKLIALHKNVGLQPVKWVTWGGLAAASAPGWLKKPVDRLIKKTAWGDVVALLTKKI